MQRIFIYIDGGSRGNPGPSAIGVVFCNEKGQCFKEYGQYIGEHTNNEAEYLAAIFALKKLKEFFGKQLAKKSQVEIRTDSEFLIKQIKREYKIEDPEIQKLFLELWNLRVELPNVKFRYVAREKNLRADSLVNQVLDQKTKEQKLI